MPAQAHNLTDQVHSTHLEASAGESEHAQMAWD